MAVPAYVNVGAASSSASAAALTPALPGSRVNNNVLIAYVAVQATGKTIAQGTAGWTLGGSENTGAISTAWYYRLVDGTEAAPAFTWTGATNCRAAVFQYSGNATSSYIAGITSARGNSTAVTAAGITSSADNSKIIHLLIGVSGTTPPGTPTNWTSRSTTASGGSVGGYNLIDGTIFVSGETSQSLSQAVASQEWVSFSFELKGTGAAAGAPNEKVTAVTALVLEDYGSSAVTRVTAVSGMVLEDYGSSAVTRVTAVSVMVLRSVASSSGAANQAIIF